MAKKKEKTITAEELNAAFETYFTGVAKRDQEYWAKVYADQAEYDRLMALLDTI